MPRFHPHPPSPPQPSPVRGAAAGAGRLLALALLAGPAAAQPPPDRAAWPVLPETFASTGGGGWMIGGYRLVVVGDRCVTAFTATSPEGEVFRNIAVFRAARVDGGVLCDEGAWSAADGSAAGTTPLVAFLRDGVQREAPR
jgi:hypothetical protein